MSPQVIELLIFAAIAFFLVNKLFSILGTTNESDKTDKSVFGESFSMKDVTQKLVVLEKISDNDKNADIIEYEDRQNIAEKLPIINSKLRNFDLAKFVKGSIAAFSLLTDAAAKDNKELLENMVDKRFLEEFLELSTKYSSYDITKPIATVKDLYFFGNNVFIKILFRTNSDKLKEIWTFTKNSNDTKLNWFLSNIELVE